MTRLLPLVATLALLACGPAPAAYTQPATASRQTATLPADFPAHCQYRGAEPDPACTPGATDPRVTQANIQATICRPGYTKTVRPPTSYTEPLKRELMARYGDQAPAAAYELDHAAALEIGGSPTDPRNLWPELWGSSEGAHAKDHVENAAHAAVCSGRLSLADAQQGMSHDWLGLGRSLGVSG